MNLQLLETTSTGNHVPLLKMQLTQEEAHLLLTICVGTQLTGSEPIEDALLEKVAEMVRRSEQQSRLPILTFDAHFYA